MSDRNRQLNLADALRALPLQAPERSAWPELAASLRRDSGIGSADSARPEPLRRFVVPAALAAGLIGVFVLAYHPSNSSVANPESGIANSVVATVSTPVASSNTNSAKASNVHNAAAEASLVALQQRSQALESWLRETGGVATPLQGQDLAAATEIENLIGLVDVELSAPRELADTDLWQRRVALLEDLSALRYSNYQLAAGGRFTAASLTN